jgi:hypothetical protein
MKDPFDILRAELVSAAERAALPAPRKRWGWLRRPSRPVAILLVALVITGSAAAAVLSLTGSASQPLVGRVPGSITPASLAGYRYTIAVTPGDTNLSAGAAGWDSWIVYSRRGTSGYGGSGGGLGYPTATNPIFGGSGPIFGGGSGPTSFGRGTTVEYVLTGPQVWAVRIGSRTIRTVSSRALPTGDRVAVFFVPAKGPVPVFIPGTGPTGGSASRPGRRAAGARTAVGADPGILAGPPRGKHPPGMKNSPTIPIVPLDRSGQVIATQLTTPPDGPMPLTWMAPGAVTRWWPLNGFTVPYHHKGYHGRTHPGPGVCELAQHGLPALHAEFGHTIAWISPVPDALGEVFVSCIDAEYYMDGWPLQVGVLLDGHRPGQVLGPIPGARPVSGQPEMVDLATGHFPSSLFSRNFGVTAKRVGNAWLVAQGGSGLAQRVQVLNSLRISKLDLHHLTSRRASH